MEQPKTLYEQEWYWQVACKKCENPEWTIWTTGTEFIAKCRCGNTKPIKPVVLQRHPEDIQ